MEPIQKIALTFWGLFALTALWAAGIPANADAGASDPVAVELSLNTPSTFGVGEPVVLRYKILNISDDQTVGVQTGMYQDEWYSLSLRDSKGLIATVLPAQRPQNSGGLQTTAVSTLPVHRSESGYIVVSRFWAVSHPGRYTLTVQIHARYATVPVTEQDTFAIDEAVKTNGTLLTNDYVFPLMITLANPTQLKSRAEALLQEIRKEQDNTKLTALYSSLFSMPEAQAGQSWEALATKPPRMYEGEIANGLARIHSVKTVDLLVQMLESPSLAPDNEFYIKTKIDESYNDGDATVKAHIKALAASRGGTMPEKVTIPQMSD